jgi:hypothetical protein
MWTSIILGLTKVAYGYFSLSFRKTFSVELSASSTSEYPYPKPNFQHNWLATFTIIVSLVRVAGLCDEVLRLPLLRAVFCELVGKRFGMQRETHGLFLLGLLLVMNVLQNMRMPIS